MVNQQQQLQLNNLRTAQCEKLMEEKLLLQYDCLAMTFHSRTPAAR